jgi:hypothetical protein
VPSTHTNGSWEVFLCLRVLSDDAISYIARDHLNVTKLSQCFAAGDYASLSKPLYIPQDAAPQPEEPTVPPRRSPRLNP